MRRFFTAIFLCLSTAAAAAEPRVLATLKPVHSLVAGVMEGAGRPELLIGGALSAHSYALKPSDARKLNNATLIVEVGPGMETYLSGAIAAADGRALVWQNVPGVRLLPARRGGLWGDHRDSHGHDGHGHRGHGHGTTDPHLWLDPQNAIALTGALAQALAQIDPPHAALYRANAARQTAMLKALDRELAARLAPVRGRPYLVFHDAYQYFEARYGLTAAGTVTVAPDRPIGARRVSELRQAVAAGRAVCLFREPQFSPKLIESLGDNGRLAPRTGVLDPLGADLQPGPDLYPRLMRNLAQALRTCLLKNR